MLGSLRAGNKQRCRWHQCQRQRRRGGSCRVARKLWRVRAV